MADIVRIFAGTISGSIFQISETIQFESGSKVSGSLVPTGSEQSLGDLAAPWKDAYLSSGSLFLDGKKAISVEDGRITISGPANKDIVFRASGSGRVVIDASSAPLSVTGSIQVSQAVTASAVSAPIVAPAVIPFNVDMGSDLQIRNIPAAVEEVFDGSRMRFDLTLYNQAELVVNVTRATPGGAHLAIQWSLNQSTWNFLDGADGPKVPLGAVSTATSDFQPIAGSAKTNVFLRIVGMSGSFGGPHPRIGTVALVVK